MSSSLTFGTKQVISTWKRAAAKSAVWKIIGVISLIGVGWTAGINMTQIGKITFAYHVITLVLYMIHERIWNKISWGKIPLNKEKTDGISYH